MTGVNQDLHLEVAVCIRDGEPFGMPWAPYESAFLNIDAETAYDRDAEEWVEPDEEVSARADEYLIGVLAFPAKVIAIYRQWTGPNGYDINIVRAAHAILSEVEIAQRGDTDDGG